MNTALGIVGGLVVGGAIGWGVATQLGKGHAGSPTPAATTTAATTSSPESGDASATPLFSLDGQTYTEKDLPSDMRTMIYDARHEAFERIQGLVSQFALQLSLAKAKDPNAKADALPPMDELLGVQKPSEEEMKAPFEANKGRLPPGMTYDQVKGEIEKFVTQQKMQEAMRQKSQELAAQGKFKMLVSEPVAPVVELDVASLPSKGKGTATLVEAADYLCPHCQETQPEVEAMLNELGDKIKFVAVTYALNPEGLSGTLARGAYCARQQGDDAFWKYHETAFKTAKEKKWKTSDAASKEPLEEVAKAAGLDAAKLEACVDSPEAKTAQASLNERMNKAGVSGTPTFFLNGRRLAMHGPGIKDAVLSGLAAGSH